jgi:hypothetical protein
MAAAAKWIGANHAATTAPHLVSSVGSVCGTVIWCTRKTIAIFARHAMKQKKRNEKRSRKG